MPKTFWKSGSSMQDPSKSLERSSPVVAAPILDRDGNVGGILYGERTLEFFPEDQTGSPTSPSSTPCCWNWWPAPWPRGWRGCKAKTRPVACVCSSSSSSRRTGPAPGNSPRHAERSRCRRQRVVLRHSGFSRIAEKIGAARTFDWINDVMGTLSDCVSNHQGVLVDYIGDELMAMWGAPEQQADHARRACLAAIDMIECCRGSMNGGERCSRPFDLGIGISWVPYVPATWFQSQIQVRTSGKYRQPGQPGAGGDQVFQVAIDCDRFHGRALDEDLLMRRLADVRVVNIEQPVSLYELPCGDFPNAPSCVRLRRGAALFRAGGFPQAAQC